ncbi:LTA synthase family protein [Dyadobacter jiangsuensis]|uniref:Phosphoglycerol transferase MdoB-like AlkP superfamily enzyme n=1 Tax=Dyadobacter jiangsuensis TaxID=1591085 RepID=A0A2P8FET8_9BACT|nr:alkaline phosphatase family protein [Dyadobacter jiangsuensis]PSL20236.1 phosphoglycerol transferase MdoB-like AlkP superfamily enzyme [Dyadobacter jiangsuensis]
MSSYSVASGFGWRIHQVLLIRLLGIMILFTVCRILFYFFNQSFFPDVSFASAPRLFLGGLRFDLVAVLYTNILYVFLTLIPVTFKYRPAFQKFLDYLFIITNSIALLGNCADFIYYRFTIKRSTWSVLQEFSHENNMHKLFGGFLVNYWYVALVWVLLVAALVYLTRRWRVGTKPVRPAWQIFLVHSVLMTAAVFLFIGGVKGGFRHSTRPITLSNAGEYVDKPKEMFIVLNTPFCIYKTLKNNDYQRASFFKSEQEMNAVYSPIHYPDPNAPAFRPKNVVILIWESFGKEMVGTFNRDLENGTYKGYTPFVDSLMQHSKVHWYSFANGAKSIEAIPSVLTSIPGIMEPFILTRYTDNKLPSLPEMLQAKGYHTSFFHGAPNGSMGFKAFTNLIGIKDYYGKTKYNNDADYDGIWGIWDEEFLQFWSKKLDTFQQPFMSTLFTVSSHDPYKVPARYQGKFPKGPLPIYECMGYTDYALRRFFDSAKTKPWFKNTLFVITADHSATFAHYPQYQTSVGNFSIPILFYAPGEEMSGGASPSSNGVSPGTDSTRLVQQIDIMPSILGYLHYDKPYFGFGKNVFGNPPLNFAVNYDGAYQWFNGPYVLQFDGRKTVGLYKYQEDKLLKNNLAGRIPEVQGPMELQVKAFIQQYSNRMLDDRLTVTP